MYEAPSSCSPGLRPAGKEGPGAPTRGTCMWGGGAQTPHKLHSPRECSVFLPGMFYVWPTPHHVFDTCPHVCTHRPRPRAAPLLGARAWLPITRSSASLASLAPAACTRHSWLPTAMNPSARLIPSSGLCGVWATCGSVCVGSACVRDVGLDEAPWGEAVR